MITIPLLFISALVLPLLCHRETRAFEKSQKIAWGARRHVEWFASGRTLANVFCCRAGNPLRFSPGPTPEANPSRPVTKLQIQGDPSKATLQQSQKQMAASVVSTAPMRPSPSYMQIRLEQIAAGARKKKKKKKKNHPFENGLVAAAFVGADTAVNASTDVSQPPWSRQVLIANAGAETPSVYDTEGPTDKPSALRAGDQSKEVSVSAPSLTYNSLQIKSRLRELGYMSPANGRENRRARDALRDFKVVNGLPNDDRLDLPTSDKLGSETAIRADQSIVGTWSTASCESRKITDIRLLLSMGAKTSEGIFASLVSCARKKMSGGCERNVRRALNAGTRKESLLCQQANWFGPATVMLSVISGAIKLPAHGRGRIGRCAGSGARDWIA